MDHKGADALVIAAVMYAHIYTYTHTQLEMQLVSRRNLDISPSCCFVFSSDWHHLPASYRATHQLRY